MFELLSKYSDAGSSIIILISMVTLFRFFLTSYMQFSKLLLEEHTKTMSILNKIAQQTDLQILKMQSDSTEIKQKIETSKEYVANKIDVAENNIRQEIKNIQNVPTRK